MGERVENTSEAALASDYLNVFSFVPADIYIRHGRSLAACPDTEAEMLRMISAHNERPLRGYTSLHD